MAVNDLPPLWRLELLGGARLSRLSHETAGASGAVSGAGAAPIERFRTQKTASLLAFLALRRGPHSREALCEAFWPETDPASARNSLRVSLSSLRTLLESQLGAPILANNSGAGTVLHISGDTVALHDTMETDVEEFENALKKAGASNEVQTLREALKNAISLYRGPLLQGCFAEWLSGEENRLEDEFVGALGQLCAFYEAEGRAEDSLEMMRRALAAAPYREEIMLEVLRLSLILGRSDASREFQKWHQRAQKRGLTISENTLEIALRLSGAKTQSGPDRSQKAGDKALVGNRVGKRDVPAVSPPISSLPERWTTFFGRETEIAALHAWLCGNARLITLTGPVGVGKTRLAIEVLRRIAQGLRETPAPEFSLMAWVDLADLPVASLMPTAILQAIQIRRTESTLELVVAALRQRAARFAANTTRLAHPNSRILLIFDNFEHLCDDGAPLMRDLLDAMPELTCLVTSRRVLGFSGEHHWPLRPLDFTSSDFTSSDFASPDFASPDFASPDFTSSFDEQKMEVDDLQDDQSASAQLFFDRARQVQPDFAATPQNRRDVARLCTILEGVPLALELSAAHIAISSPSQILGELNGASEAKLQTATAQNSSESGVMAAFSLNPLFKIGFEANLTAMLDWKNSDRAAPRRHRSLRSAIAWSEAQLSPATARFWAQISVFRGGFTFDAAARVCQEENASALILALRDASLVTFETRGQQTRVFQLETLRQYAQNSLSATEIALLEQRHARFFESWVEAEVTRRRGAGTAAQQAEIEIEAKIEVESANLQRALDWLSRNDPAGALRFSDTLRMVLRSQ